MERLETNGTSGLFHKFNLLNVMLLLIESSTSITQTCILSYFFSISCLYSKKQSIPKPNCVGYFCLKNCYDKIR